MKRRVRYCDGLICESECTEHRGRCWVVEEAENMDLKPSIKESNVYNGVARDIDINPLGYSKFTAIRLKEFAAACRRANDKMCKQAKQK